MASSEEYEITSANDLRVGGHALLSDHPCKVVEIHRSKTGKHGGAKLRIVGLDIFTQKKVEEIVITSHTINVPKVKKNDLQAVSIDKGDLTLMNDDSSLKYITVPEESAQKAIKQYLIDGEIVLVTVLSAMGKEIFVSYKLSTSM